MTEKTFVYPFSLGFFYVTVCDNAIYSIHISKTSTFMDAISDPILVDQDIYKAIQPILDDLNFAPFKSSNLRVIFTGSSFRKLVWEEINKIPAGSTKTYKEIAEAIGYPKAYRAVGSACGENEFAIFVPCHRVVGNGRNKFSYRWGSDLKQILLERESK